MDRCQHAIAYFEGLIRDTDQVLPHCSEALRAELLERRGYYELALEALRPASSDEPLAREQLKLPWTWLIRRRFEQVK